MVTTESEKVRKLRWAELHKREEKEYRGVEEMIRKKDEKALGKWLKEFGRGYRKEILEKDNF